MTTPQKKNREPATAVAVTQDVIGTILSREGDVVSRYLVKETENTEVDPGAVYEAIIAEIMGSQTITDVLNLPETSKLEEHEGSTLELRGYRVLDSEFEQGAPVYFVIGGVNLTTDEKVIISCGEQAVMAQLMRLRELDAFPIRVIPTKAKRANRFGRFPIRLKLAAG